MSSSESARRFHFIREIASGGFGSVYLTKVIHADNFSRLVAVKLLHPRWSENEEIASRMRDEARLLGWLRHKNIVDVMDLTLIDGRCAVMMEYLEAVDAKVAINHCKKHGTRIPLRASLEMCASVASALDAAYNRPPYAGEKPLRVIHRDIKPSNIMIDDSGLVKVLDFGVARAEFDERESKTQEMAFGSLEYMPPERLFFEPESPASDVYSLGATLYELLALEKFGKAKLRPAEHEKYFEDRFDVLLDRYPLHDEAEKLLHELLMDMLEFDEPERPSAADCVSRMRAFARRLPEGPLEEWAETIVPTLLREERDTDETTSPGSLVGMVLTEDPKALDEGSVWDENTGMSTQAIDLGALDDEMTGSLADDARWRALKQATIEDMEKRGELPPNRSDPRLSTRRASLEKAEAVATKSPTPPESPRKPLQSIDTPAQRPVPEPPALDESTPTPAPTQRMELPREIQRMREEPEEFATPTPVDEVQPAPPSGGGRGLLITAMFMFGVGGFFACVVLGVFAIAAAWSLSQPTPGGTVDVPSPEPIAVAPAPVPVVAPTGPATTFVSKFAGTTKFRVSCTNGKASGTNSAVVAGEALGKCRITAQTADRKKASTYVENPEPREYICFAGDSKDCE